MTILLLTRTARSPRGKKKKKDWKPVILKAVQKHSQKTACVTDLNQESGSDNSSVASLAPLANQVRYIIYPSHRHAVYDGSQLEKQD